MKDMHVPEHLNKLQTNKFLYGYHLSCITYALLCSYLNELIATTK